MTKELEPLAPSTANEMFLAERPESSAALNVLNGELDLRLGAEDRVFTAR